MRFVACLSLLLVSAPPVLAFEIEEIGTLQATFAAEEITQPTVIATSGGQRSATAFMAVIGGTLYSLSLAGHSMDNSRLDIQASYMQVQPSPQATPFDQTISYSPNGTGERWTSEDAPTRPNLTFTTLEMDGEEGRAVGSFSALLCFAESYGSDPDTSNCRQIVGSFDTRFFVE